MNDPIQDDFEPLLRDYLASQLDGQLGKASARFAALPASSPSPELPPRRSLPRKGQLIAAVGVVAASLLLAVWFGFWMGKQRPIDRPTYHQAEIRSEPVKPIEAPQESPQPGEPSIAKQSPEVPKNVVRTDPLLVGQQLRWRTIDEGIVYLDANTPVRKLRRQRLERVEWYDEARGARVEIFVPREEVQFVPLPSS